MNNSPFSLDGKTVLVTGASSGIGQAIAIECSKMMARVIVLGRNQEKLQETIKACQTPQNHKLYAFDLTDKTSRDKFVASLDCKISGFVHSAGINKMKAVKFLNEEDFDAVMNINLKSGAMLVSKIIAQRKFENGGSVVWISSVSAQRASPANSIYMASKGAVNSFMRGIALELAGKKIRSNAIMPGMIETPFLAQTSFGEEEMTTILKNYPLGRFGSPQEIAYAAVYLLSDTSSWITGTILTIDGGVSLR